MILMEFKVWNTIHILNDQIRVYAEFHFPIFNFKLLTKEHRRWVCFNLEKFFNFKENWWIKQFHMRRLESSEHMQIILHFLKSTNSIQHVELSLSLNNKLKVITTRPRISFENGIQSKQTKQMQNSRHLRWKENFVCALARRIEL